jgi:hypothetical protein
LAIAAAWLPATAEGGLFGRRSATWQYAAEEPEARITLLPDDSAFSYVTIITHADWQSRPEEVAQVERWQAMPEVAGLAGKAHWLRYTEKDAIYQTRLREHSPVLPAILVQNHEGYVMFKDYAGSPAAGRPVIFPWNKRPAPCPGPQPGPAPKPDINVVVAPIPDRVPLREPISQKEPDGGSAWILVVSLIAVAIVVAVVTFAVQFHRRVSAIK